MTVIAAVRDPGLRCTWIGADTRCSFNSGQIVPSRVEKWIVKGRCALGITGGSLTWNLLARAPRLLDDQPEAHTVAIRVRQILVDDGWTRKDEPGGFSAEASFIYARGDEIHDIDGYFSACLIDAGMVWARGSGMDFAIGAGHAMAAIGEGPNRQMLASLNAACAADAHCGLPLFIHRIEWE